MLQRTAESSSHQQLQSYANNLLQQTSHDDIHISLQICLLAANYAYYEKVINMIQE